jgi:hypothetical protein
MATAVLSLGFAVVLHGLEVCTVGGEASRGRNPAVGDPVGRPHANLFPSGTIPLKIR